MSTDGPDGSDGGETESGPEVEVAPDYVETDQGTGDPMLLVVGDANSGDVLRLLNHLQERYEVGIEYVGEHQRVYTIHPVSQDG